MKKEGGRPTGQLDGIVGGGNSPAAFGFVCVGSGGRWESKTLATWQNLLRYAVDNVACGGSVAGNQPTKQTNKQTKYCVSCQIRKMCLETAGV